MPPQRFVNPWAVLLLALAVLVLDQWTKIAAIEHLANPAHPLVVLGDGERSVRALFETRGVAASELSTAQAQRYLWRYNKSSAIDPTMIASSPGAPRQLLAIDGTGFPSPRRMRVPSSDEAQSLKALVASQWRVEPSQAAAILRAGPWQAKEPVSDLAEVVPLGQPIALLLREITVVDGFMKLVYAENPGAAWGMMRSASPIFRQLFFACIAVLASAAMIWAIWSGWMGSALSTWALAPVLGGAIGNLVDRGLYSVVVDFILNYVGEHRWPVYNVADIGITVGVALILLELLVNRSDPEERAPGTV